MFETLNSESSFSVFKKDIGFCLCDIKLLHTITYFCISRALCSSIHSSRNIAASGAELEQRPEGVTVTMYDTPFADIS